MYTSALYDNMIMFWEKNLILPICRKGDQTKYKNYRAMFFISCFQKLQDNTRKTKKEY